MIKRPIVSQLSPLCADLLNKMLSPNPLQRIGLVELGQHPFWNTSIFTPLCPLLSHPYGQSLVQQTYGSPTQFIPQTYTPPSLSPPVPYSDGSEPGSDGSDGSVFV